MPLENKQLLKLRSSPGFRVLMRKRLRVCVTLSVIMVGFYSSFYLCMAYLPAFMATPVTSNGVVTIGLCYGIASMWLAAILSGYYAWWSTRRYEVMKAAVVKGLLHEQE